MNGLIFYTFARLHIVQALEIKLRKIKNQLIDVSKPTVSHQYSI